MPSGPASPSDPPPYSSIVRQSLHSYAAPMPTGPASLSDPPPHSPIAREVGQRATRRLCPSRPPNNRHSRLPPPLTPLQSAGQTHFFFPPKPKAQRRLQTKFIRTTIGTKYKLPPALRPTGRRSTPTRNRLAFLYISAALLIFSDITSIKY